MKIAVFHQFLDQIGGSEIVCLTLARELKADIYTTNIDREKIKKMGFEDLNIISIGKVPKHAPWRQQLAHTRLRFLNLKNKYDYYIIGGDWAISAAINHKPNLWYVHSPIREIYDLYEYVRQNMMSAWKRPIFDLWVRYNRSLNRKYTQHAQKIICNSQNTKNRAKKYLSQKAEVINPPIETKKFKYKKNGNFWLSVNRLINHKRIDMQLKAFQKLPDEKLIVVGSYEKTKGFLNYKRYLEKIKPKNVEILHWADDKTLAGLYANCKAFITTSQDEDFGMAPLEAMASGKPVIAPNEGGYKETVLHEKTGLLINDINEDKLIKAIKSLKNPVSYKKACQKHAKNFDTKIFIKKIKQQIKQ